MRFETTVPIAADPRTVWRTWTDVEHWPDWTPSVLKAKRLDTSAEFGVGSRARLKQPGMRAMTWTVTESVPGRSFIWRSATAGVRLLAGHVLEPAPGDLVTARLRFELAGPLAAPVGWLIGARIRRYLQMETDGVKRYCEAGH